MTSPLSTTSSSILLGWKTPPVDRRMGFTRHEALPPLHPEADDIQPFEAADSEGHLVTIAPTGKGKGRSCLIPTLLRYPGAVVVIDPKGEAVAVTAQRRREMGHEVVVLDPFRLTSEEPGGLNPFDVQALTGQPVEDFAVEMAHLLHHGREASLDDPFWDIRADGLNAGICAAVATVEEPANRHFLRARDMMLGDDVTYSLAVLLDTKGKQMPRLAYQQIAAFLQTEDKCRSGICATAQQHYGVLYGDGVEKAVSRTSFDLSAFRDGKPLSIYLVVPPQKLTSHGALLRLWVGSLLSAVLSRRRRPATPTLFLLDEAAQLGELEGLRALMTLMRGYGVRCWSFWQDLSQMKRLYERDWETVLNNAATVQVFGVTTHLAAKALGELLGEGVSFRELLTLPPDEQLILEAGGILTRARKLDYLKDPSFKGLYGVNHYYEREQIKDPPTR